MIKNNVGNITVEKIEGDNTSFKQERNKNYITDKSKEITINKQIQKGKNKKKKNKQKRQIDLMTASRKINNQNPSLNRQNIEKLYNINGEEEMIAYVQGKRKESGGYVLYNVCTHTNFMSDHLIVFPEPKDILDIYIGQCIQFNASSYQYNDIKYSLKVYNIKPLNISEPFNFYFDLNDSNKFDILNLIYKDNSDEEIHVLVKLLALMIDVYSAHMFGSRKFIMSMIFNLFYMGSSNHELSDSYNYNLSLSKRNLIYVFSDIIYTLEKYRQDTSKMILQVEDDNVIIENSFDVLHHRLKEICLFIQNPDFNKGKNNGYGEDFSSFCETNEIELEQAEYYIRDNTKRFKLKKIKDNLNFDTMMYEMINAANVVIPVVCSIKNISL